MNHYVGLDVSLEETAICDQDASGTEAALTAQGAWALPVASPRSA